MTHLQPKESEHATQGSTSRTRRSHRSPGREDRGRGEGRHTWPFPGGEDRGRGRSRHTWTGTSSADLASPRVLTLRELNRATGRGVPTRTIGQPARCASLVHRDVASHGPRRRRADRGVAGRLASDLVSRSSWPGPVASRHHLPAKVSAWTNRLMMVWKRRCLLSSSRMASARGLETATAGDIWCERSTWRW